MPGLKSRLRIGDLLGEIDNAVAVAELPTECGCGCGTPLDGTFTSLDFASMACQSLWGRYPGDTDEARHQRAIERAGYESYSMPLGRDTRMWPPTRDDQPWSREQQLVDLALLDSTDEDDAELLTLGTRLRHQTIAERAAEQTVARGLAGTINAALRAAEDFLANPLSGVRRTRPTRRIPQVYPGEAREWRALDAGAQERWWEEQRRQDDERAAAMPPVPVRVRRMATVTVEQARRASLLNLATALDVPPELMGEPGFTIADEAAARAWVEHAMDDIVAASERRTEASEGVVQHVDSGTAAVLAQLQADHGVTTWFYDPATGEWGQR